jgi:hypothetical protein
MYAINRKQASDEEIKIKLAREKQKHGQVERKTELVNHQTRHKKAKDRLEITKTINVKTQISASQEYPTRALESNTSQQNTKVKHLRKNICNCLWQNTK